MVRKIVYTVFVLTSLCRPASADTINYIATIIGSGSLNGTLFSRQVITFVGEGDTDAVVEAGPELLENDLSSLSFTIGSIASGQFTGSLYVFSTDTGFGFGRISLTDVFDTSYPDDAVFNLQESLEPVDGEIFGGGGTFDTTAGSLTFIPSEPESSVFAADIFEPTSCSLLFVGLVTSLISWSRREIAKTSDQSKASTARS